MNLPFMHHARRRSVLALIAGASTGAVALALAMCGPYAPLPTTPPSSALIDTTTPRQVSYRVTKTLYQADGTHTEENSTYLVTYTGVASTVRVAKDGAPLGDYVMRPSGMLSPTGSAAPIPILDLLGGGPTNPADVVQDGSWTRLEPADSDVATMPSTVVVQSRVAARPAAGPSNAAYDYELFTRVVDNPGARKASTDVFGTDASHAATLVGVLSGWHPLGTGHVEIDPTRHEVVNNRVAVVLWPAGKAATPAAAATSLPRMEATLQRM